MNDTDATNGTIDPYTLAVLHLETTAAEVAEILDELSRRLAYRDTIGQSLSGLAEMLMDVVKPAHDMRVNAFMESFDN
jgi:hypothetical protein